MPQGSGGAHPRESAHRRARINEIEARVRHDVIAFTMTVGESIADPPSARWLHYGLTSNDVVDTAQALLIREASQLIEAGLAKFGEVLERRAREFQHTPQIGRTHGIHAEPITFGLKDRQLVRGKSPQSSSASAPPRNRWPWARFPEPWAIARIWAQTSKRKSARGWGWRPIAVTSQVIQRDRHAQYVSTLAIIAATLEKIALEIRHLQRTEVREAEEPFGGEQRGSSAMPHKRNPVSSEQFGGLARVVRANSLAAMENIALWHERDISHSSVERIILPDSTILVDYMLARMTDIVSGMRVFPERMKQQSRFHRRA